MSEQVHMTDDLLDSILNDVETATETAGDFQEDRLGRVANLVRDLAKIEDELAELELVVKQLIDKRRQLEEVAIPEALAEHGLSKLKLTSGATVEVRPFYNASLPKGDPWPALAWLEERGFGDLIKRKLSMSLGRDSEEEARAIKKLLAEQGHQLAEEVGVHPQTLKAFVREQLEAGREVPRDLFNIYVGQRAKIKGG